MTRIEKDLREVGVRLLRSASSARSALAVFVTVVCAATNACSSRGPDLPDCVGTSIQSLFGASETESYLGLAQSQQRAVVQIVGSSSARAPLCSGIFVSPDWIVTAAHCLAISPAVALVQAGPDEPLATLPVTDSSAAPGLDLALLHVDFASSAASYGSLPDSGAPPKNVLDLGVEPVPFSLSASASIGVGDTVEVAGYGLTEDTTANELRFLVETAVASDATSLQVDGFGVSGACGGDSGGPLLVRDQKGRAVTIAALSNGSTSCKGRDSYVRLAADAGWLANTIGSYANDSEPCGSIDAAGRCLYGSAVWCESGTLTAQECAGSERCGWKAASSNFRCTVGSSACDEVDTVGRCRNNLVVTCSAGRASEVSCAPCGSCRLDGKTGAPYCAPASN